MAERSNHPGGLTFHGGQVPDNDTVQEPAREPEPDRRLRRTVLACLAIIALAVLIGAVS